MGARKRTGKARPDRRAVSRGQPPVDDTAIRSLSKDELKRWSMDAWEPSLLRHMLEAENKLRGR